MKVTISKAAEMAGITRATFYRHIETKGITVEKDSDGNPKVDVSELVRVYGDKLNVTEEGAKLNSENTPKTIHPIQDNTPEIKHPIQRSTPNHTAAELEVLKERLRNMETVKETLENERSREREQLNDQIEALRENLEKAQSHHKQLTALLTDQRSEEERRGDTVHHQSHEIEEMKAVMQDMIHARNEEQSRVEMLEKRLEKMKRAGEVIQNLKGKNKELVRKTKELEKEAKKTWFQKLVG